METTALGICPLQQRAGECGREREHEPRVADRKPRHTPLPLGKAPLNVVGMIYASARLEQSALILGVSDCCVRQNEDIVVPSDPLHTSRSEIDFR
jgi:hypothetical protein